jgi:hypothetical protein
MQLAFINRRNTRKTERQVAGKTTVSEVERLRSFRKWDFTDSAKIVFVLPVTRVGDTKQTDAGGAALDRKH